jgi:hypothetical protein
MTTLAPLPTTSQLGAAQLGAMQLGWIPHPVPATRPDDVAVFVAGPFGYGPLPPVVGRPHG